MDKKKSKKKFHGKKIFVENERLQAILIFSGVAAGILLGVFASVVFFSYQAKHNYAQSQQSGVLGKTETNASRGQSVPPAPSGSFSSANYTFSGTVTKVQGNKVFVDYFSCGKGNKTYAVTVTKSATIVKREDRQEKEASFSDIKKNDNVAVSVLEDINEKNDLTAREIKIMGEINLSSSDSGS